MKEHIPDQKTATVLNSIYKAFLNTAEMQAFRRGHRFVLHCIPLKISPDLSPVFNCGYSLIKLRGLEKLVVHYIFSKPVYRFACGYTQQKGESRRVATDNTKALSRFLENGYYAFEMERAGNDTVLLMKKSISD